MNNENIACDIAIFCNNIRLLRQRHHLSKHKMAKLLQIGVPTLNQIERGVLPHCVRANTLFQIYYEFGISPDQMLRPFPDE